MVSKYKRVAPIDDLVFECFSDANEAGRHDSGSQSGYLITACHLCVLNGEESDYKVSHHTGFYVWLVLDDETVTGYDPWRAKNLF